ncbi:M949_RS01915 family surface polysaccharide biosynthesis protein [Aquimarina muelleri]|uniref:M949_RS01915 family surface polysaccharide biosynthesis protein n=1 Tax=Aquimarina muelleri TaxID=279356 RepID=UPI003F6865DF
MNQTMENLHKIIFNTVILSFLLTIISCKESKQTESSILSDKAGKEVKQEENIKVDDTICDKSYFFCQKIDDKQGVKHIIVDQKISTSEIYDAIEEETYKYESLQLEVKILLNGIELVKLFDEESSCNGDSEAKIIDDSLKITDLDKDNIKEISFLYNLVCKENITPSNMKFVIIEGKEKYKIRGAKKFFADSNGSPLNENLAFNIDQSFTSAPKEFLDFAADQWNANLYDNKIGELSIERKKLMEQTKRDVLIEKEKFYK